MVNILSTKSASSKLPVVLRPITAGEFAVAVANDLEIGRVCERSTGWSAIGLRGYIGMFSCQAAAVAALALKISVDSPF
ncbi:hypothetical protein KIH39_04715 [Telmatocola sphagniphila]|uniref:Uncharacterized protein n=1 Tax=Telmatocola sphagniphila TaxID=1123043 RepID=A0A8E6B7C1_9BACT|nr:hypothetical protein [Telmatocola sphagniphila]QVL33223.1 hypothetical protein KIH39_04715 [Telmatocola sphagniphila]